VRRFFHGAAFHGALSGAALLVALAGAAFLPRGGQGAGEVPTLRVEPRPFVHRVPAEGNFKATRATAIAVPRGIEGPLRIAWLAPEGTLVRSGEVVVRFDPTDMEKALRDAEDELAKARLKTDKERSESAAEIEKLGADARVAELELDAVRRFQKKDATIFSKSERIESELDGTLAGARAEHAREAERVRRRLSKAELDLLAIQARQAGFKIESARQGLRSLSIVAPHDGILVFRRDHRGTPPRVGDSVWQGQPLADLPDLAQMEAEVYVLEADAGGLGLGKPATVEVEAVPGSAFPARIARVDALAKPRLRGSPVQYFAVVLALPKTEPAWMKPGARVRALLTLDELPRALAVPRQAVFESGGRTVVYRREATGGFTPVPVTLGPSGMGRVVIAAGLKPGDTVALRDPTRGPEPSGPAGSSGGTGASGVTSPPPRVAAPAARTLP
jgi:HlyD family secretion protein